LRRQVECEGVAGGVFGGRGEKKGKAKYERVEKGGGRKHVNNSDGERIDKVCAGSKEESQGQSGEKVQYGL